MLMRLLGPLPKSQEGPGDLPGPRTQGSLYPRSSRFQHFEPLGRYVLELQVPIDHPVLAIVEFPAEQHLTRIVRGDRLAVIDAFGMIALEGVDPTHAVAPVCELAILRIFPFLVLARPDPSL